MLEVPAVDAFGAVNDTSSIVTDAEETPAMESA
jgi:hypothetical protein